MPPSARLRHSRPRPATSAGLATGLAAGLAALLAVGTGTAAPAHAAASRKPPLSALGTLGPFPAPDYQHVVRAFVINLDWAAVQPQPTGPLHTRIIDLMLDRARAAGMRVRLRIQAGTKAPAWAKQAGGSPVPVAEPGHRSATVGRFWTPAFGARYAALMHALAARYDGNPLVAEVAVTRCTTVYPEPFVRQSGTTARNLFRAGYSVAADQRCIVESVRQTAAAFRVTNVDLAVNPYAPISAAGGIDWRHSPNAFTFQVMAWGRRTYGSRFVLANYSMKSSNIRGSGSYQDMYARMRALGPPLTFQTANTDVIGDWRAVLDFALHLGAGSVELPSGYTSWSPAALAPYAERLRHNG